MIMTGHIQRSNELSVVSVSRREQLEIKNYSNRSPIIRRLFKEFFVLGSTRILQSLGKNLIEMQSIIFGIFSVQMAKINP